jgi:hypothetical protein
MIVAALSAASGGPGDASRVTGSGLQLERPGRLPVVLDYTAQLDLVPVALLLVDGEFCLSALRIDLISQPGSESSFPPDTVH